MLKRIVALMMAIISLAAIGGCKKKSEPLIENEMDAKEIIECSKENMFGLEKIAIFEDRAVAVFDEKICEDFEYDEKGRDDFSLKDYLGEEDPPFRIYVSNMKDIWPEEDKSSIELKDGHYVVTVIFPNKESYKENPDEDFEIWALDIGGMEIEIDTKSIELEYIARSYDIMWYYKQVFNRTKGTWDHVDEEEVGCMTEPLD